jgi:hypothetical protein
MLLNWSQALSLAILGLNVTRIAALDTRSVGSYIDDALQTFEDAVVHVISDDLNNNDGVLGHVTMDYKTFAKTP